MAEHQVHLVGGVPLASAAEVFKTTSRILGAALPRIPDGEVGRPWMGWFAPVITKNPFFEKTDEEFRPHSGGYTTFRYRLKSGLMPQDVVFSHLRHAQITLESYNVFRDLKAQGLIRKEAKFLCTLAHPIPIIRRYFADDLQALLEPAFERALAGEVQKIVKAIPHEDLAIQWDCASAIFATLQLGQPNRFGQVRETMFGELAKRLARLGRTVPAGVDLLYHFCYGNSNGKHSAEPVTTRDAVVMANNVQSLLGDERPIQLIHLPVPIDRDDDAYFAPLADLDLRSGCIMALVSFICAMESKGPVAGLQRRKNVYQILPLRRNADSLTFLPIASSTYCSCRRKSQTLQTNWSMGGYDPVVFNRFLFNYDDSYNRAGADHSVRRRD